jgi:hypothetical protein
MRIPKAERAELARIDPEKRVARETAAASNSASDFIPRSRLRRQNPFFPFLLSGSEKDGRASGGFRPGTAENSFV